MCRFAIFWFWRWEFAGVVVIAWGWCFSVGLAGVWGVGCEFDLLYPRFVLVGLVGGLNFMVAGWFGML